MKHLHGGRNVTRKEKGEGGERKGRGEKSNGGGGRGGGGFSGNSRKRTRGKGIIPRVSKERVSNYRRIALHSVRRAWLAPSKSNSFRTLGCRTPPPPPPPLNRPPPFLPPALFALFFRPRIPSLFTDGYPLVLCSP